LNLHVTGASGFLGGYVTPELVSRGHQVSALARSDTAANAVRKLGAEPLSGDLDDRETTTAVFRASGADVLVNLASLGFGHAPTIINAAEVAGIKKAVFVSTTSIFTKLETASKGTRHNAEELVRASSMQWTIVRPTMIYGDSGDRNMWRLLRFLQRSRFIPLPGGGKGLQQPVHVADLADLIVAAVESDEVSGRTYDAAGPTPLTLRAICEQAAAAVGKKPVFISLPLPVVAGTLRVFESTKMTPKISSEQIRRLGENKAFDITRARNDLGFNPREFASGIQAEAALLTS
jgi:uncharacterized protein YbjT (DUF2867 family)